MIDTDIQGRALKLAIRSQLYPLEDENILKRAAAFAEFLKVQPATTDDSSRPPSITTCP